MTGASEHPSTAWMPSRRWQTLERSWRAVPEVPGRAFWTGTRKARTIPDVLGLSCCGLPKSQKDRRARW